MIDLFRRPCCIFTHIQATLPAQSLMWWKNPKGQIMFKWHFDDISLSCLTFGEFHFSCALHLIHADPFLIPYTTKHYFYDFSPFSQQNPLDYCSRNRKYINRAAKQRILGCEFTWIVDLSSLETEIKNMSVDCGVFMHVSITHNGSNQWILISSAYTMLQAVNMM